MATTPNFTSTPRCGIAQIATGNTNRDGSGTLGSVLAAGASGSRVEHIDIVAAGTTTAGMVRLFIDDGSNVRLWREVLVSAITPSGTVAAFRTRLDLSALSDVLLLPSGHTLKAGTHNAETFNVFAVGGDF